MKKYIYWGLAPLLLILVYLYFSAPENSLSDSEAEERLELIIADTFLNTRFDRVTVEIDNGILDIILEDTEICSENDATFRIIKHINLRDFETVRTRILRDAQLNASDPQAMINIPIMVDSKARARIAVDSQHMEQIYNAAREELGWGQEAGNRTYDLFTQSTAELQNISHEIREKCSGGIGIQLVDNWFSIIIKRVDAVGYIELINYLIQQFDE